MVIIGGGLVGTSAAYELACLGADVVLVDAAHPGRASDAGAGIVSPQTWRDEDDAWWEFGCDAAAHLTGLVTRLGEEGCDPGAAAFARCGSLVVALAEHEDPWFEESLRTIRRRSPGVVEIPGDEAVERFPPLATPWRALHNPEAARVDGRRLTGALREAIAARKVRVVAEQATGIAADGDRAVAVELPSGPVACDAVVVAAGAWSGTWEEVLGTPMPVTPLKGQIVHVTSDGDDSDRWSIVQPILNFYLVPWPGGRVACGGTFEHDAGFDTRPTAAGVRDLLRECVTIAPGLGEATFTEVRVGLRPRSTDDRPLLGAVPGWSNVLLCTGHGAEGLLLGPYSAALVARAATGEAPRALAPFAPARFMSGAPA